ncbi:lipopolysaccharide biosynthesis protein [Vibrio aquaticus]|uniref:Lipopolysaccharide biosynthesis protein n=1 Tax=Vibrio aquaticus TaxID=2496559 RepID=A0A432CY57_9VIBR|nr:oligosaccharide flippase family protein [Vibrio aquaticus]RTZ16803.1 lipopolysaccharide biosynthesis protein [Vibrio aquaticus]
MKSAQIKSISLYAFSVFLMKGFSLITLPLMAYYLLPEQLGQLELIGITTVFASLVIGLAMHENLYRFIGTVDDEEQQKTIASKLYYATLLISLGATTLLVAVYYAVPVKIESFSDSILGLMALVLCYEAPLAICLAWLRLQGQAMRFFKICTCTVALQFLLLVWALNNSPTVTTVFAINVFCTLSQYLFLHFTIGFSFTLPTRKVILEYVRYSSPLMLSAVVAFGLSGAERWIIAGTTDLVTLGMYAIAAKFALGVGILIQPFHMWWMPKRFHALEQFGRHYTAQITQQGIMLLCFLALIVAWLSQLFIQLLLPTNYLLAASYVSLAIITMLFKELVELTNLGVLYRKKTTHLLLINLSATLIAFSLCYFFSDLGIKAILVALVVGQVVRFVATFWHSQTLAPLRYQSPSILGLILLTTLFLFTSGYQNNVELALLMLVLQPLALVAYGLKAKLIDPDTFKSAFSYLQTYLGKAS